MEVKLPESSIVNDPHKIEGPMKEARGSFYELAKSKVRYLSLDEIQKWHKETFGRDNYITTASYILYYETNVTEDGDLQKWITNLEIVVNLDAFRIGGKDYTDLIPIALDHELYEAWLSAKRGVGSSLNTLQKHLLARRHEFLLAARQGLEDKLFEWCMAINPGKEGECKYALKYARRRMQQS
jgi:hypothetical protein